MVLYALLSLKPLIKIINNKCKQLKIRMCMHKSIATCTCSRVTLWIWTALYRLQWVHFYSCIDWKSICISFEIENNFFKLHVTDSIFKKWLQMDLSVEERRIRFITRHSRMQQAHIIHPQLIHRHCILTHPY